MSSMKNTYIRLLTTKVKYAILIIMSEKLNYRFRGCEVGKYNFVHFNVGNQKTEHLCSVALCGSEIRNTRYSLVSSVKVGMYNFVHSDFI